MCFRYPKSFQIFHTLGSCPMLRLVQYFSYFVKFVFIDEACFEKKHLSIHFINIQITHLSQISNVFDLDFVTSENSILFI